MSWYPSTRSALGAALLALAAGATAAGAQQATLTLSRSVSLWNDVVTASLQGTGCAAGSGGYTVNGSEIDITLACSASATPFSAVVAIGPLYPREYTVRVLAAGAPAPLATARLSVRPLANLDVELPAVATDAAPIPLVFTGLASSSCFLIAPPTVDGHVIATGFADECPILPPIGPVVFRQEYTVGPLAPGEYEVRFFDISPSKYDTSALARRTLVVHDADGCLPADAVLCLDGGRFKVEARWKDFTAHQGVGHALPLAAGDGSSGLFWFFSPGNVELTVKVLDGCASNDHWWVFVSSGSTVEYTVTVTDTATGEVRTYPHAAGQLAPLVADTSAFSCGG